MTDTGDVVPSQYAVPSRFRGVGATYSEQISIATRRGDRLEDMTTWLLDGQIDLPDYAKLWVESPADINAHANTLERILKDGRFSTLFILDLLDRYPDGIVIYRGLIENKLPTTQAALTQTVASLENGDSRARLSYKFNLGLETPSAVPEAETKGETKAEGKVYASLGEATDDLMAWRLSWAEYEPLFLESKDSLEDLASILNELTWYRPTPGRAEAGETRDQYLGHLLISYPQGPELVRQFRSALRRKDRYWVLEAALRSLNDPAVNRRFGLASTIQAASVLGGSPSRVLSPARLA